MEESCLKQTGPRWARKCWVESSELVGREKSQACSQHPEKVAAFVWSGLLLIIQSGAAGRSQLPWITIPPPPLCWEAVVWKLSRNLSQTNEVWGYRGIFSCRVRESPDWLPWCSAIKNPIFNAGDIKDVGLIPGSGRSPGGGSGSSPQCSCLENPMDRGAWWATVHRVAKSQTWLSN